MLAFFTISALVIVTPGPDTALTIRNALLGGRRGGVRTAAGVATGQACWTLATSAGIAALLSASRPAFLVLRLLGAAYLVYLGASSLVAAFRGSRAEHAPQRGRSAFRQGLLTWLTAYGIAVARAGDFLRRGWVRRALDALTGAVLVALGLRVAAERP